MTREPEGKERVLTRPPNLPPSLLPLLLVRLNRPGAKLLIPELRIPKEERITIAVRDLQKLREEGDMPEQRKWSLGWFKALREGKEELKQYLADEGVWTDRYYLSRPDEVIPGMEFVNRDTEALPTMLSEYFGVKSMVAPPTREDITAAILGSLPVIGPRIRDRLEPPPLKESLLLKDYVDILLAEGRATDGPPLIGFFGLGKGEEMVRPVKEGYSCVCFDIHSFETLKGLFKTTFNQARFKKPPEIVQIGKGRDIDLSPVEAWRQEDHQRATVFICSEIDFSKEGAMPDGLRGLVRASGSIYALHEMPDGEKGNLFKNMDFVTRGAVVVVDGNPTNETLNDVTEIGFQAKIAVTFHDSHITHILCLRPKEIDSIARESVPDRNWTVGEIKPPLPRPFLSPQQIKAVGRRL